jgi:hypothetical protein
MKAPCSTVVHLSLFGLSRSQRLFIHFPTGPLRGASLRTVLLFSASPRLTSPCTFPALPPQLRP